uniref:Uncharacterized protein n=1 Tax=Nelumbo nucifera TaxID=4432 RepID=A0A822Y9F3_NELNU|nr:TPA_asm: hypothetical protein HUJ06_030638 [Nelumbo nucifera]
MLNVAMEDLRKFSRLTFFLD